MLPRHQRLSRGREVRRAARGRRAGTPSLVVSVRPRETPGPARAAFAVSRAVGPAVVRNRARRRLRPLVAAGLAPLGPVDVLVRVLPAAVDAPRAVLVRDLTAALSRASRTSPPAAGT